jgi:hypothetical protein
MTKTDGGIGILPLDSDQRILGLSAEMLRKGPVGSPGNV